VPSTLMNEVTNEAVLTITEAKVDLQHKFYHKVIVQFHEAVVDLP